MIVVKHKYTKQFLAPLIAESYSFSELVRKLELAPHGGTNNHLKKVATKFNIDFSHFNGRNWTKGKILINRQRSAAEILIRLPRGSNKAQAYQLRRALLAEGVLEICTECGTGPEYNRKPLRLQIHHIDGDVLNNVKDNLQFLCPNCHSQTDNYMAKNIKATR